MGLEVGGGGTEEEEKKEEEKIPLCESIGHRFLWGRCPKRRNERTREMGNEGKEYDVTWKSFIIAILTLLSLPCWKTNWVEHLDSSPKNIKITKAATR